MVAGLSVGNIFQREDYLFVPGARLMADIDSDDELDEKAIKSKIRQVLKVNMCI
jgi:hypothetical protein